MAISNLVTPSGNANRPSVAAMFGQRPSNDNFAKESDIISGSFIASATNSLTQLNTQLSKLQESSKSIVKSMTDAVSKIKTVDRDMSQRFKKLNADITASRPDFSKFLYKAPPLPLAEIAPGSIQQGKLANTAGIKIPEKENNTLENLLNAAGMLGAGRGRAGATPRTGGGASPRAGATVQPPKGGAVSPRAPAAEPSKPPTGAPEAKPRASVPEAGSRTGSPTPAEPSPPKAASGEPVKVGNGKAVLGTILKTAGASLGALAVGIQLYEGYEGYKAATEAYDTAIASGVDPNKAMKEFKAAIAEIIGEQIGIFVGGVGGAKAGAMIGSVFPGVGTLIGGLAGSVAGSVIGGDLGKVAGQALGDTLTNETNFNDAFKTRWDNLSKAKQEQWIADTRKLQGEVSEATSGLATRMQRPPTPVSEMELRKQYLSQGGQKALGNFGEWKASQEAPTAPPPAESTSGAEAGEEGGERGNTSAPTGEATDDKANITGAPSAAGPTATTPPAPPPAPRPNQGAGGADVIVNKTTNMSSSSGGEGQNVTNPNLKMNAHNPFIKDSLARQVLPEHN